MIPSLRSTDPNDTHARLVVLWAFVLSTAMHLIMVAGAATDIPYADQWGAEGAFLYPRFMDGGLRMLDLLAPHNEHRILLTRLLDLAAFRASGGWDPLVQILVGTALRGLAVAMVVRVLIEGRTRGERWVIVVAALLLISPLLAWENALCGFQTQVAFSIILVAVAFHALATGQPGSARRRFGYAAAAVSQFAMAPGMLAAPAILCWLCITSMNGRRNRPEDWIMAGLLLIQTAVLWTSVPAHAELRAEGPVDLVVALARILAWPHVGSPLAAAVVCLPLTAALVLRTLRSQLECLPDGVILLGIWGLGMAAALAWSRGGQASLEVVVPSRYADFLGVLVLAGVAAAFALSRRLEPIKRLHARWLLSLWLLFVALLTLTHRSDD